MGSCIYTLAGHDFPCNSAMGLLEAVQDRLGSPVYVTHYYDEDAWRNRQEKWILYLEPHYRNVEEAFADKGFLELSVNPMYANQLPDIDLMSGCFSLWYDYPSFDALRYFVLEGNEEEGASQTVSQWLEEMRTLHRKWVPLFGGDRLLYLQEGVHHSIVSRAFEGVSLQEIWEDAKIRYQMMDIDKGKDFYPMPEDKPLLLFERFDSM